MKMIQIAVMSVLISCSAMALEIEKVKFDDTLQAQGQSLVLNGVGLRTKRKIGMNFKVYVAGLYATAKSSDAPALIADEKPKVLELVFLRSLDKGTLIEAWTEGFDKNCESDCEAGKAQLKAFNDLMGDVKEGSKIRMSFDGKGVEVAVEGKAKTQGRIDNVPFKKQLLSIFIGKNPPTEDLKNGLLGK